MALSQNGSLISEDLLFNIPFVLHYINFFYFLMILCLFLVLDLLEDLYLLDFLTLLFLFIKVEDDYFNFIRLFLTFFLFELILYLLRFIVRTYYSFSKLAFSNCSLLACSYLNCLSFSFYRFIISIFYLFLCSIL